MSHTTSRYADRIEAGRELRDQLGQYQDHNDVVVLALPRGGIPVALPIADGLKAPLDVLLVRKLGVPTHPEVAMGAIASVGGTVEVFRNERIIRQAGVSNHDIDSVYGTEFAELRRRESVYRNGRTPVNVRDKVAIVVDDGLATGSTMLAALTALRQLEPAKVVVAVPVGSAEACGKVGEQADRLICPLKPDPFYAVGQGYEDFTPTEDEEVRAALRQSPNAYPGEQPT